MWKGMVLVTTAVVSPQLAKRLSAVPEKIPEGGTGYICIRIYVYVNTELANRFSAVPEKIPEGGTGCMYM